MLMDAQWTLLEPLIEVCPPMSRSRRGIRSAPSAPSSGATTAAPEGARGLPNWITASRNQIERLWAGLKEWRTVATRCRKTARSFMEVLCLKTALDWPRDQPVLIGIHPGCHTDGIGKAGR